MVIGELENVKAIMFRTPETGRRYVYAGPGGGPIHADRIRESGYVTIHHAHNLDGAERQFFIFYQENSYWPTLWVVRADTWEDAYDEYLCEDPELLVSEEDEKGLTDSDSNNGVYTWNNDGRIVYVEAIQGFRIVIDAIYC